MSAIMNDVKFNLISYFELSEYIYTINAFTSFYLNSSCDKLIAQNKQSANT